MLRITLSVMILLCSVGAANGEEILFEDQFDGSTLSDKWKVVGLQEEDYRIRDGGLEVRVQSKDDEGKAPLIMVALPFNASDDVIASVQVTPLDRFTEQGESAGLFLTDPSGPNFGGTKMYINGHLLFSPGLVEFIGEPGEEGDGQQYTVKFWPANDDSGELRIIKRRNMGFFQVGPTQKGEYLNFFHSAISDDVTGFGLSATGAPADEEHWVRFDNFRIVRQ